MGESSHRNNSQNKGKEVPIEGQQAQPPFRSANGVEGNRVPPGALHKIFKKVPINNKSRSDNKLKEEPTS